MWWHYKAWWFKIDDSFSTKLTIGGKLRAEPLELLVDPPIFLDFLDSNWDSYASFRTFTERFGLDWFCEFDNPEYTYNLKVELDKRWKAHGKKKNISLIAKTYMEKCLKRMAKKIKEEQQSLKLVWDTFEKHKPLSPYDYPDSNPELSAVLDINWEKRKSLELRPTIVHQGNKTKILEMPPKENNSLIAVCHFEAWTTFNNKWWIKECRLCHGRFFSSRDNKQYCDRVAPPKLWNNPEPKNSNDFQNLKCNKLGPQITYNLELQKNDKMRTYREKYKRRAARLSYLKNSWEKGQIQKSDYQKEEKKFKNWKEENKPKKGERNGNHN